MIVATACACCEVEASAAEIVPTTASLAAAPSTPKPCTGLWDFIDTNCQLTWYGITVYGTIDAGVGWQSHGAPFDPRAAKASYLIQKQSRSSMWGAASNALGQSTIGIKGTEPIGGSFSFVFAADAGFDPYSFRFSDGPGSVAANAGVPLNLQSAHSDSSRASQWYNGQGYVGVSSSIYGTLTVFRQNSLTLDGVIDYDPMGASNAFSPIGFQGITCGGGNTENCRNSTSLKYRLNVGVAALWQFGGYGQNNASNGAYQFGVGADIPNLANGVLSVDAIYSSVRDAVAISLGPGSNDAGRDADTPVPANDAHGDDLRQYRRHAAGQIRHWAVEGVRRLRTNSICGAQRSADRFYRYLGNLSLRGLCCVQQPRLLPIQPSVSAVSVTRFSKSCGPVRNTPLPTAWI
jgi:predicted porin